MKTTRPADHVSRPDRPPTFLVLCPGDSVYLRPLHPHGQAQQRGTCRRSGRTFQELAEVKVVLRDHVGDHLLVEADDLEQHGFQKNGFCVI